MGDNVEKFCGNKKKKFVTKKKEGAASPPLEWRKERRIRKTNLLTSGVQIERR